MVDCQYCSSRPKEDLSIVTAFPEYKRIHGGDINQITVIVKNSSSAWDVFGDKALVCVYDKSGNIINTSGEFSIGSGDEKTLQLDVEMPHHDEKYKVVLIKSQWLKSDKCEDYKTILVYLQPADEENEESGKSSSAEIIDWIQDHMVEIMVILIIIIFGIYIIRVR